MDPKERYEQERLDSKQQRYMQIIEVAQAVFIRKGIEKTTMQQIAAEANIGIATVFRYFPQKQKLITAVATKKTENTLDLFQNIAAMPITCLEKLEQLFDYFISHIDLNNESIKFLEDFESYAAHIAEPLDGAEQLNEMHHNVAQVFFQIIEEGIKDGSIRQDVDVYETLTTLINAFGNFARKLTLQSNIPYYISKVKPTQQLTIIKKIFLDYLKP
ncbi:MAG: TetR/AcrR family transcriptional regulator [Candidatus Pristimantibacillus sp.]